MQGTSSTDAGKPNNEASLYDGDINACTEHVSVTLSSVDDG